MVIWGISYVWLKEIYEYISPFTTVCIRVFIATIFLTTISLVLKRLRKINKKDFVFFALMGILDPLGYFLLEGYGIQNSTPTIAAVVISMIPVFLPLAAYFFLKEKLSLMNIAGIVISFIGVLLVIVKDDFTLAGSILGITLLFMAVLCSVVYNILLKKLLERYNIFTIITVLNIISTIYFIPLFFIFGYKDFIQIQPDTRFVSYILLLSLFASTLAFLFYAKGVQVLGASMTNVFANLIPVVTALFSWIMMVENISARMTVGIFTVVIGLFIAQVKFRAFANRYGRIWGKLPKD